MSNTGAAAAIAIAASRRAERQIVQILLAQGATGRDTAVSLEGQKIRRRALNRLLLGGGVREADGRYWLDEAGLKRFSGYRRGRAVVLVLVVLILMIGILWGVSAMAAGVSGTP